MIEFLLSFSPVVLFNSMVSSSRKEFPAMRCLAPQANSKVVALGWKTVLWMLLWGCLPMVASAQQYPSTDRRHFPLNHMTSPGTAAAWAVANGKAHPAYFQPVRITVPTQGRVDFFDGSPARPVSMAAPGQAGLLVGQTYRVRLTGLPEFPNQEFYPTIELIDRLHPPEGLADRFPVEVQFSEDDFEFAAQGRLVTKVIYLEQPDRIPLSVLDADLRVTEVPPQQNALAEADLLGRPVAIVRLGGRTPDSHNPLDPTFFGFCPPVQPSPATATPENGQPANPTPIQNETPQARTRPGGVRASASIQQTGGR
ncbi:hypothetical protein [Planctopirus hydrillae]|nr:hypothetical protein [Planctopirus hydrillae]